MKASVVLAALVLSTPAFAKDDDKVLNSQFDEVHRELLEVKERLSDMRYEVRDIKKAVLEIKQSCK
jgi:hypothetical protein